MDSRNVAQFLLKLFKLVDILPQIEEEKNILNKDVQHTIINCWKYSTASDDAADPGKLLQIESALDFLHDELNTGHWSEVPTVLRKYFTCASFIKCLIILKTAEECKETLLKDCLKSLDMGLLLGAPIGDNEFMLQATKYLSEIIEKMTKEGQNVVTFKRKLEEDFKSNFSLIRGIEIDTLECPSLECFDELHFRLQVPLKIQGCMLHWPASTKWLDVNYLLKIAGNRTVPIEIGSHYIDENWSQKLMTLGEFITGHYLSENGHIGYLAQHNLFEQIHELKEDIRIPEYCCLSRNYDSATTPDINAWFGPKGTVSPLHYDPKNNILAQVYGTKQLILFAPKDGPCLYPHEGKMLFNTAQVDPLHPDLGKHPKFPKARMYKCLLEPGEMVFIPQKWWHHVTALDKSFSVSFWWE